MSIEHEFLLGIIIAVITWVLTFIFHENFVALFSSLGTAFVLIPIIFIFLSGVLKMNAVSSNTTAMNQMSIDTTTNLIDYVIKNLPGIIVSDLAGTVVGFFAGIITRMFSDG
jgi:hypothetical protein